MKPVNRLHIFVDIFSFSGVKCDRNMPNIYTWELILQAQISYITFDASECNFGRNMLNKGRQPSLPVID